MIKNSLGELKLSPLKDDGRFVFINNEVRVNGKVNKGDYVKIYVEAYEQRGATYVLKEGKKPYAKMVVRTQTPIVKDLDCAPDATLDELYEKAGELYKNQFYFGKTEV